MTQEEEGELRAELLRLQQEHRDLDAAIAALQASPGADIIQVQRLKKRKLQLRDRITFIEDQLTPDIIAESMIPKSLPSGFDPMGGNRFFGSCFKTNNLDRNPI